MQSQKDSFTLAPIAFLKSVYDHKFGTPRQGLLAPQGRAFLTLEPQWQNKGMFDGLSGFSHVWLIGIFHLNQNTRFPSKIHPPRLLGKSVGVLASRSPHHPNSLGLSLVKLDTVEHDTIRVSGVDYISGTPILDIKPYLAEADRPSVYTGGWADALEPTSLKCIYNADAEADIVELVRQGRITDRAHFLKLVEEVLRLDPRPLSYRKRVNERFAIVLGGLDVHARFFEGVFTVISIRAFVKAKRATTKR